MPSQRTQHAADARLSAIAGQPETTEHHLEPVEDIAATVPHEVHHDAGYRVGSAAVRCCVSSVA